MSLRSESREVQLELFEYKPSLSDLQECVRLLKESNERVRRNLFARQSASDIQNKYLEARQNSIEHKNKCLEAELEFLKAHICKG